MPAADFDETTQEIKKTQLTLIGCTSRTEAIKHGNRALNRNRFLTRTATWDAGIDSLGCLPWDPVVPPIGQDGRVVSGTSNSVNIDREVLLQPGHTYYIRVKSADDDTVEEQTVAAVYEETVTATLTVTGNWTHVPVLYELYVFYEEGQDRGLMRVLRISRRDDHTRRITAIEYSAEACDDSGTVDAPETPSISHQVANLHAEEVWRGGIETRGQLSWTGFALLWYVWHKRTSDAAYIYDGQTVVPSYELSGLDYSVPYTFCVASTRDPAGGETVALTMMAKTDLPADVSNVQSSLQKYGILITWDEVVEPYKSPVTYEIRYVTGAAPDWDNGIVLANGISGNTWSWEIKVAGDYTVMIKAIDTFGNRSETEASAVVTILAPQQVTPAYSFREEAVTLSWAAPSSSFPILEYRLYYGATFAGAEFVTSRRALDYTERVSWTGTRRWWIQAVDIAGNEGEEAFIDVEVAAPAVVQTLTAQVIDNTVLLRWGAPAAGTLPTASYQVRRGDVFASAFIIGQVSGTFATSFETEAATYKYWVVAIDSAGNYGTESAIQAIVNEPPDYILRADDDLGLLSGTMSNCESYESELLLPVNTTETWEEHFTTRSWVTSQDKIDAGYPLHLTPTPPSAYWELVVDYGTTLPGTMISLLPVLENLSGTVAITPTISWSADGDTWTPYEGMYQVFATQFRYVKYRMDFDPASDLSLAALQTVRAKLDIKLKKDSGSVVIDSTSGVVVTFNRTFIDLAGAPQVQAPYFNNSSIDPAVAVVDFEDAPYPESFTVYLYDKNGTLITSGAKTVSWSAEGY
jgi:predicted phage tail protein